MTLVSQYRIIYSCIYNHVGDGRATARKKIKIISYKGEPYNLLSYAINILEDVRGYAINEKKSSYNLALSKILTYAKNFKYLGGEFKTEVTDHAKNMYSNITSNHSPYKEVNIWINDFEYIISHPHKDSEAYNFLSSNLYIYSMKFGEFTNVVMPIVSDIMTQYIVYKRFISNTPNPFNSNKIIINVDGVKYKVDAGLYYELSVSGVKYTENNVLMITKTSDGQLVWLEKENSSSGLEHIKIRHQCDFENKGIKDIPEFLEKTLKTNPIQRNLKNCGYEAIYEVNGSKYLAAYGKNGYIVSAYPVDK